MEEFKFKIWRESQEHGLNRRYFKLLYTAALRLGAVATESEGFINFSFVGNPNDAISPHRSNRSGWTGKLLISPDYWGDSVGVFESINVIIEQRNGLRPKLITFWPTIQNPDAQDSYTDPLVDIAMSSLVPEHFLEYVANQMHAEFIQDPGMSPAVHMQGLNQELLERVKKSANAELDRYVEAVNRALELQKEAMNIADEYKTMADIAKAENYELQDEISQLKRALKDQEESKHEVHDQVPPAVAVTKSWQSKTGSSYINVGIRALVRSIRLVGAQNELTYVDEEGEDKIITDFGSLNKEVFEYLKKLEGKTAVFLVTQKPNGPLKLASDTMLLPQYRTLWHMQAKTEKEVAQTRVVTVSIPHGRDQRKLSIVKKGIE
jgi:hypothetical protein